VATAPPDAAVVLSLHEEKANALPKAARKLPSALLEQFAPPTTRLNAFDPAVVSNAVADAASYDRLLVPPPDYVTVVSSSDERAPSSRGSSQQPRQPEPPPPGRGPSPDSPAGSGGTAGGIVSSSGGGVVAMLAVAIFALFASGLSSRVATRFATPLSVPRRLSLERPG
jgi:hypothetical protein